MRFIRPCLRGQKYGFKTIKDHRRLYEDYNFREGNDPRDSRQITYKELLEDVCRLSNVLLSKGIKKGDRIAIYMPVIVEQVVAMLACVRIGAVHSVVVSNS